MPPGCCGDISIFAELEDTISYSDLDEFKMLILFYSMSVMTYTEVFHIENAFNGTYPYRIVKIWSHFGIYLEQCVKVGCYSLGLKSWVV